MGVPIHKKKEGNLYTLFALHLISKDL